MAVLIGMSGTQKGLKFDLNQDQIRIGRHTTNDLALDDASVSGEHCTITRDGQRYTLTDLGSTNGTRVNGVPATASRLKPKDIVQVGNVELMFDGTDVEVDQDAAAIPEVEVVAGPALAPDTFQAASPFGKRRDTRAPWAVITAVLIVLVGVAMVLFLIRLF